MHALNMKAAVTTTKFDRLQSGEGGMSQTKSLFHTSALMVLGGCEMGCCDMYMYVNGALANKQRHPIWATPIKAGCRYLPHKLIRFQFLIIL